MNKSSETSGFEGVSFKAEYVKGSNGSTRYIFNVPKEFLGRTFLLKSFITTATSGTITAGSSSGPTAAPRVELAEFYSEGTTNGTAAALAPISCKGSAPSLIVDLTGT